MDYISCKQDAAGTGAKGWPILNEGGEGVEEAVALEMLEKGGGLAARDDQTVQAG